MTNFLTLHADPTANLHAATKQYVDTEVASVVPATGNVIMLASGQAVTVPSNSNVWNTVTAPAGVPTGATAVILVGTNPSMANALGDAGTEYYEASWGFRRDSTGTIFYTALGYSFSSGFGIGGLRGFSTIIVPLTAAKTFQANRVIQIYTYDQPGSLTAIGYVA
jgi:hypothetical protein